MKSILWLIGFILFSSCAFKCESDSSSSANEPRSSELSPDVIQGLCHKIDKSIFCIRQYLSSPKKPQSDDCLAVIDQQLELGNKMRAMSKNLTPEKKQQFDSLESAEQSCMEAVPKENHTIYDLTGDLFQKQTLPGCTLKFFKQFKTVFQCPN